jgi:DNA replication protein DnaC
MTQKEILTLLNKTIENQYNILLTGPTGTGKTVGAISIVILIFIENEKYCKYSN